MRPPLARTSRSAKPLMDAARRRSGRSEENTMTPPPSGLANAAGSLLQEMAGASSICQISPTRCQARTRLYRDGKLELEGFPVADISDHLADGSATIWLDLRGPDRDDLAW